MKMLVAFVLFCAVASSQAKLSWKSCGGSALTIRTLEMVQDKITFPGALDVTLDASTLQDLVSPVKVTVELKKNSLVLPCIPVDGKMLGSCTYNDICKTMEKLDENCHSAGVLGSLLSEAGLPCRCPLKKNPKVQITGGHVVLPKVPSFVAFLAEGKLDIEAKAEAADGTLLGCIQLTVDVHFVN